MPTTYTDQFWIIDPANPPVAGTVLTVSVFTIIDQNDNGVISRLGDDSIDGVDITASWPGDTVTVTLPGGSQVTITGATFYLADGRAVFTPTDGSVLQDATLVSTTFVTTQGPMPVGSLGPPCFVSGTLIGLTDGKKLIEDLVQGDRVLSHDGESVVLRKILRRKYQAAELKANDKVRPVRITAGALGNNLPTRDLLVSRQHRMLVDSAIAERMFGTPRVLVSAIKLTVLPGVFVDESVETVEYFHLLFDKHEVIYAEDAPSETLYTGPEALKSIGPDARAEIEMIFPEIRDQAYIAPTAHMIPPGHRQKKLIERHLKNKRPLNAARR